MDRRAGALPIFFMLAAEMDAAGSFQLYPANAEIPRRLAKDSRRRFRWSPFIHRAHQAVSKRAAYPIHNGPDDIQLYSYDNTSRVLLSTDFAAAGSGSIPRPPAPRNLVLVHRLSSARIVRTLVEILLIRLRDIVILVLRRHY